VKAELIPRGHRALVDRLHRVRYQTGLINLSSNPGTDTCWAGAVGVEGQFLCFGCVKIVAAMCTGDGAFDRHVDCRFGIGAAVWTPMFGESGEDEPENI